MMKTSACRHIALTTIFLMSDSTFAMTMVLQPRLDEGKDISLYERTDIELSSSKSLYAINTGPPGPGRDDFASLIEFDLASVPNGNVLAATLWLYENNAPTFSFQHVSSELSNTIRVQPAATAWEEDSLFYSTLPNALLGYDSVQVVDAVNEWFSWDVTAAVGDWLSGEVDNNGFLITSAEEVRNGMLVVGSAFDASEQPNAPYLEIELVTTQPGDYDRDLDVDGADFLEWQRQTGSSVMEYEGADGNGDGTIDAADLTVWSDNFGFYGSAVTAAGSPLTTVPEPAAITVAFCYLMAICRGRGRAAAAAAVALIVSLPISIATGASVPFTEQFASGAANWRDSASNPVSYVPSGGVGGTGDGYISVERAFSPTADPNFASTIFRGHDSFDSSGDAFVGDWLDAGVTKFSFWIRHNASSDLSFGTRFATPANSPGANVLPSLGLIAPTNVWTRLEIPISPAAIAPEGPASFFTNVFSNIGNLQISVRPGMSVGSAVRFDLDRVSMVSESTTFLLLVTAAGVFMCVVRRPRHVGPYLAAILALNLMASSTLAQETGSKTTTFTSLPEPLASFGAATLGDWFYVYGGHVGEKHDHSREHVRGTFRRQSLRGGPWEALPSGQPLQSPALVARSGQLYRIGGLSARNPPDRTPDLHSVASVDCYDPATKRWSPIADLPQPRSSHDAVVVGDRIYVVGGWNHHGAEGEGEWLDSLLELDLAQTKPVWQEVAKTPFHRRALALAALGNKLYVIGGLTQETDFSQRVDVYDLVSQTWSRGPDLPESEYNGFGASAFKIGRRLFVSTQSDELLVLAEDKTRWESAAQLHPQRFFHRLIPGPLGSILLIGGANDEQGHLASITYWRPTRN
jgi:hypothetical protein